jgi:hypothetical protein
VTFPTFNAACDNFFSQLEAQKIELRTVQQEKNALKKLENVKKDHETRSVIKRPVSYQLLRRGVA